MTLPSFLIAGAIKSGTTSLYHYLIQHPAVYLSPDIKESRFLAGVTPERNPDIAEYVAATIREIDTYERLFEKATEQQVVGEVDPWCLYLYEQTIPRIKTYLDPCVRIVICLRNPVDRCYSHYYQVVKQGWKTRSFEKTLDDVLAGNARYWYERAFFEAGLYYKQVKAYLDAFDADQVLVFLFDELRADAAGVFRQICRFIGVDNNFALDTSEQMNIGGLPKNKTLHNYLTKKHVVTSMIKPLLPLYLRRRIRYKLITQNLRGYPPMPVTVRKQLSDFYKEDILMLQSLIRKDLSAWLT